MSVSTELPRKLQNRLCRIIYRYTLEIEGNFCFKIPRLTYIGGKTEMVIFQRMNLIQ